jgi:hypothetical protein
MNKWKSIIIPRDLLLVEIERRCPDAECNARTRTGLTKEEARTYCGFECERCGRSWDDVLTERDVPEWWEELTITGLQTIRESGGGGEPVDPGEVVTRMSENFRRTLKSTEDETGEDSL